MRALAITASVLFSFFAMNYAMCGPDGDVIIWTYCLAGGYGEDGGVRTPVTIQAQCPGTDAPLNLPWNRSWHNASWMVWVALPGGPDIDRCVNAELEMPFADGTRRWVSDGHVGVSRVPTRDGFCVYVTHDDMPAPAVGPATVRVRITGATFEGEADLPANIRAL